ncbi:methyltransferase domain-containing protein [Alicyclobacillus tolerans]|uniref:class I SAM-dependent methyltransferase n=1 Tax=Alicyclobacillus tolerans TaxID=90970 RepID=UPI001F3EC02B|nr:class I SAM-dependent methyltransferase [Alicyclobacillus tolerans]MCF8564649.1 methyltransferase domain-containing protein [Alicyclobacillus tolerans]
MNTVMKTYWNMRYNDGCIWGYEPCPSAVMSNDWFHKHRVVNVLVPGCGYGRNSLWLAKQGFYVTAFDVSDTAIELAVEQSRNQSLDIEYHVADVFDDTFLVNRYFDGIYLSNVIHLFLNEQRRSLLDRLTSLLRPNGILTFSCISVFDTNNYGIGSEVESNTFEKHEGKPLHFFSEEELRHVLSNNYEVLKCQLHTQTETDPSGESEELKLWFVVARKL